MNRNLLMPMLWVLFLAVCAPRAVAQVNAGDCGRQVAANVDSTNLQWQYDPSTRALTITGSGPMKDYSLDEKAPWYDRRNEIQTVEISDGVTTIGSYALYNLSKVRHLHLPKDVVSLGKYAFRYLSSLDSISVDEANTRFDSRDTCNALIEKGSDKLLLGCSKTRMPASIRGIDSCAFLRVQGLKEAVIPNGVTFIGTEAFNGCSGLASLVLPSQLKTISAYAFQDCSRLDTVIFPEKLDTIGIRAFANCYNLRFIRCNSLTPPRIHTTTFSSTPRLAVPCAAYSDYREAPVWKDFDSVKVSWWYEFELITKSNDDSFGYDTILQKPYCDTMAVIYAEPYDGYEFVAWQDTYGNVLSFDAWYQFYVDEDMTVTAVFQKKPEGLNDVRSQAKVWVNGHNVLLLTDEDTLAVLFDMMGRRVDARPASADVVTSLQAPAAGIYVLVTNGYQQKVLVQ